MPLSANIPCISSRWVFSSVCFCIDEYYERKDHYLEEVLDYVYECYPGVKGHIGEIDAATPITLMRYLVSLNGGIYGLDAYMKDYIANKLDVDSPIKGLYFCGSSVFAGGFNVSNEDHRQNEADATSSFE